MGWVCVAKVYAIIPAAGTGSRMGSKTKKQYIELNDLPVIAHTLNIFEQSLAIDGIILVVGAEEIAWCRQHIVEKLKLRKILAIVAGGICRQQSVYNGLMSVAARDDDIIVVHDGVRPLLTGDILQAAILATCKYRAVVVAVPVKDTIKLVNQSQTVSNTLPRGKLWAAQTPQLFNYRLLMAAYQSATDSDFTGTDDASLVERLGHDVHLVVGSYENIKITTPEDIVTAKAILSRKGTQMICG